MSDISKYNVCPTLADKIFRAVRLIRSTVGERTVEVSFSGGKDSEVILALTQLAGVKYRAIFKNTTIDPPGTISHCVSKGAEIARPPITFFQLVRKKGMPTRRCRFCCEKMKEYKILDLAIQGIRRSESTARSKRYSPDDPVICRMYGRARKNHVNIILPILEWTDQDVADFLTWYDINCHPLYYNASGELDVSRRLGCIACPLQSDQGLRDYKEHPRYVRTTLIYLNAWWLEHPTTKSHEKFNDPFELFYHNVFCKSYEDFEKKRETGVFSPDAKTWISNYFGISLDNLPILK